MNKRFTREDWQGKCQEFKVTDYRTNTEMIHASSNPSEGSSFWKDFLKLGDLVDNEAGPTESNHRSSLEVSHGTERMLCAKADGTTSESSG